MSSPSPGSSFLVTAAVVLPWQGLMLHDRVASLWSPLFGAGSLFLSVFLDLRDSEESRPVFTMVSEFAWRLPVGRVLAGAPHRGVS